MADDPPETFKPASGGLFGALGLSPKALLLVTLLALLVWWYFLNQGMQARPALRSTANGW